MSKAIDYLSQAVSLTPDGHADKPARLINLGIAYQSRFEHESVLQDAQNAIEFLQKAAKSSVGAPYTRFRASRRWARLSSQHHVCCPQSACKQTMELLPQLVWLGVTMNRRYKLISEMGDIATEAASCAIGLLDYDQALEWLEVGRSIIWSQISQLRTAFDDLCVKNPELARRMREVGRKLERAGSRPPPMLLSTAPEPDLEMEAKHHHDLASEWEQLLELARQTPGFEDFMQPRKANVLKRAAKDGPVVAINIHAGRCDALILQPNKEEVAHVPLQSFSMEKAVSARMHLVPLIGHRGSTQMQKPSLARLAGVWKQSLKVLWLDVVKPVLDSLGYQVFSATISMIL